MAINTKLRSELNDKECFMLWVELGTQEKVGFELQRRGIFNKRTGKPYQNAIIGKHAHRWVVNHPDEARKYYLDAGSTLDEDQWKKWLVEKAMMVYYYSPKMFFEWVERMNMDKYEYIYERRFGNREDYQLGKRFPDKARYGI